ncbi:zf-HC2 domain-containing protein [Streptomyces sp. NRRL S-87]|uniref:zf-HC2 domain-containing protein n=1 Tax=Streptomyces sp. NRRL S-87 TaxID=1463920 RepID=UPI00099BB813|nr:zf-HC2 domain-containing protein [Streptomyces sp. NRRL S-87]
MNGQRRPEREPDVDERPDAHVNGLLGPYVLGVLDAGEARAVEAHLGACERCRREEAEFQELTRALGEVPPEAFLEGPPEGGDLLLQRTLRQVRDERASSLRRRWAVAGLAAAASLAAVFWLGAATGGGRAPEAAPPVPVPTVTAPTPPAGTRVAAATDASTGVRMTVQVVPAAHWVRLHAAVTGIPAGERCRLVVVGRDGSRSVAGGWVVGTRADGEGKGAALDGSAAVDPEQVRAVLVENEAGKHYVTVRV